MLIGYDYKNSSELEPKYFVYVDEERDRVIYRGTYTQCLVVVGAFLLNPTITMKEINDKTNGFIKD